MTAFAADDLTRALITLGSPAEVRAASDRVAERARELRFSQGLRRRVEEARAEASVRYAARAGRALGWRGSESLVRQWIVADDGEGTRDPLDSMVAARWRAHARVCNVLPILNRKPGDVDPAVEPAHLLAVIHREVARDAELAGVGGRAGKPANSEAAQLQLMLAGVTGVPGLVRLGVAAGEWLVNPVFSVADADAREPWLRWLMTASGLEPTGVAVAGFDDLRDAAGLYRSGEAAAMVAWLERVAEVVCAGIDEGMAVSRAILAGRSDGGQLA